MVGRSEARRTARRVKAEPREALRGFGSSAQARCQVPNDPRRHAANKPTRPPSATQPTDLTCGAHRDFASPARAAA
jgi:hypothetical protein